MRKCLVTPIAALCPIRMSVTNVLTIATHFKLADG